MSKLFKVKIVAEKFLLVSAEDKDQAINRVIDVMNEEKFNKSVFFKIETVEEIEPIFQLHLI
jgi:hypothetical protein